MEKLISFDLRADFGFLKKPDVNDGLQLSFNMLHKPALLGILGAIAGLPGYEERGKFPEFYKRLKALRIGVQPAGAHERGNFARALITYTNTVGYANADGNLIVHEHTLVRPAYRVFLLLDLENDDHKLLYGRIQAGEAAFVPYLGKNEFHAWWEVEEVREWAVMERPFKPSEPFQISSLFVRKYPTKDDRQEPDYDFDTDSFKFLSNFAYFERLPIFFRGEKEGESKDVIQYEYAEFVCMDWFLKPTSKIGDLVKIRNDRDPAETAVIQLF